MLVSKPYTITAGGTTIDSFYTVPAGYILSLGGGYISVKDSCINKLRLVTPTDELVGDFRFDFQGNLSFAALTGQEITQGTTITAYIYNNDVLESEFSLTLSGVLDKI